MYNTKTEALEIEFLCLFVYLFLIWWSLAVVLYAQKYVARIHGHYHKCQILLNAQKKSLLKPSHPKKVLANFPTQKIPESKISNPKKSFDHPRHLKSGVPPWGSSPMGGVCQWRFGCNKLVLYF